VLEPKSMAVLERLLERHGDVVTIDELLDHVWVGQVVEPGSVQRHITRLRNALQDDPRSPTYIETIKKRGYRAIAPIRRTIREDADLVPDASAGRSIAVLPLENLSPDPDNAYFAAGIHEELLTRLAKIRSLKVISRTSVLEYVHHPKNLRRIAGELGVTTIVEGTVQRVEDSVRINVQLIDAQTDHHLWAETYDRQLTAESVFAIQSDIATSIVGALRATLSVEEAARLNDVPTRSTLAYDFYLIGNDYFRYPDEPQTLPVALQMYERALTEDPQFALAHAAVSHVHSRFFWVGLDRTHVRLKLAEAAFRRAFVLAPGLPEAHLAAGEYFYRGFGEYRRALEEYALAEAGMPGSAELAVARAEVYRRSGQWDHAFANWQQAIDLDPRNPLPWFQHSFTSLAIRDYVQCERYLRRAFELRPDEQIHADLVALHRDGDASRLTRHQPYSWLRALYERDYDAELEYLDAWTTEAHMSQWLYVPRASLYGLTYQLKGEPAKAERYFQSARVQVEDALAANDEDPLLYIALGETLAGLGDKASAIRAATHAVALRPTSADAFIGPPIHLDATMRVLLRAHADARAINELDAYFASPGAWSIEGILPDPRLDPVRDDPRFRALVEKYRRR